MSCKNKYDDDKAKCKLVNSRPSILTFICILFFVTCWKVNISKFFHNSGTLGTFASSRSSQNEYNIRFGHFNTVKTIKISPRWFLNTTFECSSYDFRQRQQHVKWEADVDSRDFSTSEFHAGAFAHEIPECRFHVKIMIRKSTEIIISKKLNEWTFVAEETNCCLFVYLSFCGSQSRLRLSSWDGRT